MKEPSEAPSVALQEVMLSYFEQARLANQKESSSSERAVVRQRGKQLHSALVQIGQSVLHELHTLREDLVLTPHPLQGGKLPETLSLTITRERLEPREDAQLYLLLHEEGLEVGFGFGLRRNEQDVVKEKFTRHLRRQHRKAGGYLEALLQHDYRLWPGPHQPFHTPSLTLRAWTRSPGVAVRLLDRSLLVALQQELPGLIAQLLGELLGFYSFVDRVRTRLPHIRPLHIQLPDEHYPTLPENDYEEVQTAASELIVDFLREAHGQFFHFGAQLVRTYYLSLQTRPFVILSGVAGTGKSKLAQMFAHFLMADSENATAPGATGNPHIAFVPVRPDWLDAQGLLGYYDTLAATYRATPFLRLMLRAYHDPQNPYFAILDEMNLARIEYYFSDFLSLVESRRYDSTGRIIDQARIPLHPQHEDIELEDPHVGLLSLPPTLPIPPNLYITGTVNIDETTHRLSPKVLDRANVIEVKSPSPAAYLGWLYQQRPSSHTRTPARVARQRIAFIRHGDFTAPYAPHQLTLPPEHLAQLAAILDDLFRLLQEAGFSFGLRLVQECLDFCENHHRLEGESASLTWVLDRQLHQKILPRLHGTRARLKPLLSRLLLLCWPARDDTHQRRALLQQPLNPQLVEESRLRALQENPSFPAADLPQSAEKLALMLSALEHEPYIDFHL